MKLRDVTARNKHVVHIIKSTSPKPKETKVKIYDKGPTRFIYSFSKSLQMLSISSFVGNIPQNDLEYGVNKIMKLDLIDVLIDVRDSGVIVITEKPESYPRIAYCH